MAINRWDVYSVDLTGAVGSEPVNHDPNAVGALNNHDDSGLRWCVVLCAPAGASPRGIVIAPLYGKENHPGEVRRSQPLPTHVSIDQSHGLAKDSILKCEYIRAIDPGRIGLTPLLRAQLTDQPLRAGIKSKVRLSLGLPPSVMARPGNKPKSGVKVKRGNICKVDLSGGVEGCEFGNPENQGFRHCLVVQNEKGNVNSDTTIVVPLTATDAESPIDIQIDGAAYVPSFDQIRAVDIKKRKLEVIASVDGAIMQKIDAALESFLF